MSHAKLPDGTDWRKRLRAHAELLSREVYEDDLGVGIEFEDGCDAFWVLPGEVISTVPVPAEGPASVDDLIAEYERINHLRGRVLHVIRHFLSDMCYRVRRGRDGEWVLQRGGGRWLYVGAWLTGLARDRHHVRELIATYLEESRCIKPPSPERIEQYLGTSTPPQDRPPLEPRQDERKSSGTSIWRALETLGLCRAMADPGNLASAEQLQKAAAPRGRIGRTLLHLHDRLPGVSASVDLCAPTTLSIAFDDPYDCFTINTKSRRFARRIQNEGPEQVAAQLADEYRSLDAARKQVLHAIDQAAADRGWSREELLGAAVLGIETKIYLGRKHRKISYDPSGKLTRLLRRRTPEAALGELFAAEPAFANACVAALHEPRPAEEVDVPEAELFPQSVPPAPPLRELGPDVVAKLDASAERTLKAYLQDERTLWVYTDPELFDPEVDRWATHADWIRLAEQQLQQEWVNPVAALVLLDAGDPRADEAARRVLSERHCHPEIAHIQLIWRYRQKVPEKAREWLMPMPDDDVPYAEERAAVGDPVARRWVSMHYAARWHVKQPADPLPEDVDVAVAHLDPEHQEQVHQALLAWARTEYCWSSPSTRKLRAALKMGWKDVAEALSENPYLLPGLLTAHEEASGFEPPGLLRGGDFLLVWSRLAPSTFLARLIAAGRSLPLVSQAEEAERQFSAAINREPDVKMARRMYRQYQKELEPALAIAWTRCRTAGVV